jgi:hypothetical protein
MDADQLTVATKDVALAVVGVGGFALAWRASRKDESVQRRDAFVEWLAAANECLHLASTLEFREVPGLDTNNTYRDLALAHARLELAWPRRSKVPELAGSLHDDLVMLPGVVAQKRILDAESTIAQIEGRDDEGAAKRAKAVELKDVERELFQLLRKQLADVTDKARAELR